MLTYKTEKNITILLTGKNIYGMYIPYLNYMRTNSL